MTERDKKFGLRKIYRKSWPYDNLFGSLRFETTSGQRGIWNDLLDMAKLSRVEPGLISPAPGQAYPHAWLAEFLNVPLKLLNETIELLVKTDRIEENHTGIRIINWHKYQTDADRQKAWRDSKREELTPEETTRINRENKARLKRRADAKEAGL